MDNYVLALDEPLRVGGGTIAELRLREPTGIEQLRASKHIELSSNPEADFLFARELVAGVIGRKAEDLQELPVAALMESADRIVGFFRSKVDGFSPEDADLEMAFEEPLRINNIDYLGLTLRPAKTGEMLKARGHLRHSQGPASQLQYQMSLVSHVTGIMVPVIHQMPASVIVRAAATVEVFTQPGRRTGTV